MEVLAKSNPNKFTALSRLWQGNEEAHLHWNVCTVIPLSKSKLNCNAFLDLDPQRSHVHSCSPCIATSFPLMRMFTESPRLKWIPVSVSREDAHEQLNVTIAPELKLTLHCLLISHGRQCHRCAARNRPQFPPKDRTKLRCPPLDLGKGFEEKCWASTHQLEKEAKAHTMSDMSMTHVCDLSTSRNLRLCMCVHVLWANTVPAAAITRTVGHCHGSSTPSWVSQIQSLVHALRISDNITMRWVNFGSSSCHSASAAATVPCTVQVQVSQ